MRQAGLPTPPWLAVGPSCRDGLSGLDQPGSPEQLSDSDRISPSRQEGPTLQPPCIIKLVWEHGSRGLDDENVIREGDTSPVRQRLEDFIAATGRPHFAEAFIDGREFNVPLLEGPGRPASPAAGRDRFFRLSRGQAADHRPSGQVARKLLRVQQHAAELPLRRESIAASSESLRAAGAGVLAAVRACAATCGLISASIGPVSRGFWRSTPILASRPRPALQRPWRRPESATTKPANGSWRVRLLPRKRSLYEQF